MLVSLTKSLKDIYSTFEEQETAREATDPSTFVPLVDAELVEEESSDADDEHAVQDEASEPP